MSVASPKLGDGCRPDADLGVDARRFATGLRAVFVGGLAFLTLVFLGAAFLTAIFVAFLAATFADLRADTLLRVFFAADFDVDFLVTILASYRVVIFERASTAATSMPPTAAVGICLRRLHPSSGGWMLWPTRAATPVSFIVMKSAIWPP